MNYDSECRVLQALIQINDVNFIDLRKNGSKIDNHIAGATNEEKLHLEKYSLNDHSISHHSYICSYFII
jgi:hypothetical protein